MTAHYQCNEQQEASTFYFIAKSAQWCIYGSTFHQVKANSLLGKIPFQVILVNLVVAVEVSADYL
ncbi:MAG: hypothetical protein MIO92_09995, partial [Methanosarcinaceae archaeon]|nr:hypothetical protein [Methanosarcinaceae archaeon]